MNTQLTSSEARHSTSTTRREARLSHALEWCARRLAEREASTLSAELDRALDVYGAMLWSFDEPDDAADDSQSVAIRDTTPTSGASATGFVRWRSEQLTIEALTESNALTESEVNEWVKDEHGRRVLHCVRCGYFWTPRDATDEPKKCARCRSIYWNIPRTYQLQSKPDERPLLKRKSTTSGKIEKGVSK